MVLGSLEQKDLESIKRLLGIVSEIASISEESQLLDQEVERELSEKKEEEKEIYADYRDSIFEVENILSYLNYDGFNITKLLETAKNGQNIDLYLTRIGHNFYNMLVDNSFFKGLKNNEVTSGTYSYKLNVEVEKDLITTILVILKEYITEEQDASIKSKLQEFYNRLLFLFSLEAPQNLYWGSSFISSVINSKPEDMADLKIARTTSSADLLFSSLYQYIELKDDDLVNKIVLETYIRAAAVLFFSCNSYELFLEKLQKENNKWLDTFLSIMNKGILDSKKVQEVRLKG